MFKKLTIEQFIQKAISIHGTKFDYSKVNCINNNNTKVEIICSIHKSFWQAVRHHLRGSGCQKCKSFSISQKYRSTTEEFVQKAIKIHGNKYDYSLVDYIKSNDKVEIVCSKHDSFWQTPNDHLSNYGCPRCGGTQKSNKQEFIEKAIKVHGYAYDYSKVVYITNKTKVEILCLEHGSFWQLPTDHYVNKSGCPCCAGNVALNTKDFIEKAVLLHRNKYDYSKVEYINAYSKLEIICPKHKSFWQASLKHLQGRGCPYCFHRISKPESKWLDKQNVIPEFRQYKIKINNKRFEVDGYDPKTNTIYEFLGDYWHGNPKKYKPNEINERTKKTFGELYDETMNRIKLFKENGYNVKYIWESEGLKQYADIQEVK